MTAANRGRATGGGEVMTWQTAPIGTLGRSGAVLGWMDRQHVIRCADAHHDEIVELERLPGLNEWAGRCGDCGRRYRLRLEVSDG